MADGAVYGIVKQFVLLCDGLKKEMLKIVVFVKN